MARLNLGCGADIRPKEEGWLNLDARRLPGVNLVHNFAYPIPFGDDLADEILANDLLEHFPQDWVPGILKDWHRLLKSGGILNLRIPNIRMIARRLLSGAIDEPTAVHLLYGDQSVAAGGYQWGGHKHGYTPAMIQKILAEVGFTDIVVEEHATEHNLYISARKP